MTDSPNFKITEENDITIVLFEAASLGSGREFDQTCKELTDYVDHNKPEKLVVDFESVKFFSSQSLGMLLNIWKKMESYGGRMVISGIKPELSRVFRITNLDKLFEFEPDRKAAINTLEEKEL